MAAQPEHILHAHPVPVRAGAEAPLCPTAVAVHDERDVCGQTDPLHSRPLHLHDLFFFFGGMLFDLLHRL